MKINPTPHAVLSIAGLDPSSGAGFTADLKVFAAHGLFGLACPTALTVQSTRSVRRSEPVSAALITDTLDCLADDIPIAGVKIGMLGSAEVLTAVTRWLARTRPTPVVLDPVLRSSSGHPLLPPEAIPFFKAHLLPLVTVLTPNQPEAELLTGIAEPEAAARALQQLTGAVVLTGGHGPFPDSDPSRIHDLLCTSEGLAWFHVPRVQTTSTHGTGCAFSSALLANLVLGLALPSAVQAAQEYVRQALLAAYPVGRGRGPMHHLFSLPAPERGSSRQKPSIESAKECL